MNLDNLKNKQFDKIFIKAVDSALNSLGESGKQAIYFYLKNNYNIKKSSIPNKKEEFSDSIEKIFGLGGNFLKVLILKNLDEKLDQKSENEYDPNNLSFLTNIERKKECFIKNI